MKNCMEDDLIFDVYSELCLGPFGGRSGPFWAWFGGQFGLDFGVPDAIPDFSKN